jgi:hypothetical protein
MQGSSIFRDRNNDESKNRKRGGKSFGVGVDGISSPSSSRFGGKSSLRGGGGRGVGDQQQQAMSSSIVTGDEELPLLDAWLANTASSHQVMQCFYERALEREEDDSANSASDSDYDNDDNFIDDIANVLSSQTMTTTTNVDLI